MITKDDVVSAFRKYLNRDPESENAIQFFLNNFNNELKLSNAIKNSAEYKKKNNIPDTSSSPFWNYSSAFDALNTIKKYSGKNIKPSPRHCTNFLGVKIRPDFFPNILADRIGTIEPVPIPANWHADIAEWASCLRSVELSGERFSMLELGCGWGCWMNNLGVLAKSLGKKIRLYGIEADEDHLRFAVSSLGDNEISKDEYLLTHGIAGKSGGFALFPRIESGINWGGAAIFNPTELQIKEFADSGKFVRMPVIDIEEVIKNEKKLDLMHVDIQGAELDLLTEIFDLLCNKVRYLFIGTHSRKIESGLFDLFMSNASWSLEMERPAVHKIIDGVPVVVVDGVQAWRNRLFDR